MATITVGRDLDAPPERVWQTLEPLEHHPEWMHDAVAVVFDGELTRGAGTRMWVKTKVGPLRVVDHMEVTEWLPPHRMAVRHVGLFRGDGQFTLEPNATGGTRFTWTERLRFPWYFGGPLGAFAARPVLRSVWRRNLARLAELVTSA